MAGSHRWAALGAPTAAPARRHRRTVRACGARRAWVSNKSVGRSHPATAPGRSVASPRAAGAAIRGGRSASPGTPPKTPRSSHPLPGSLHWAADQAAVPATAAHSLVGYPTPDAAPSLYPDREPPACGARANAILHVDWWPADRLGSVPRCGVRARLCRPEKSSAAPRWEPWLGPAESIPGTRSQRTVPQPRAASSAALHCMIRCCRSTRLSPQVPCGSAYREAAKSSPADLVSTLILRSPTYPCPASAASPSTTSPRDPCRHDGSGVGLAVALTPPQILLAAVAHIASELPSSWFPNGLAGAIRERNPKTHSTLAYREGTRSALGATPSEAGRRPSFGPDASRKGWGTELNCPPLSVRGICSD